MSHDPKRVLFFDGYCNLCNHFVDFMVRRQGSNKIYVASLQGETAPKLLVNPGFDLHAPESLVYWREGRVYPRSSGALNAMSDLGGVWPLMKIFLIVPSFIRDSVYRWIANNRYVWFGKRDTCRLPTPEERELFLP